MRTAFIVISSILTLAAAVPYTLDVIKGKTKPRIITWLLWSVLTGLAAAASFSDHQYASAILMLCESVESLAVVALGLIKASDRSIAKFDVICLIGALVGMALWGLFNSPSIAVLASISIDLIASLPTVKHMWQKPSEETWTTFALSTASGFFTLLAATDVRITSIASPFEIMLVNGAFVAIILGGRRYGIGQAVAAQEAGLSTQTPRLP